MLGEVIRAGEIQLVPGARIDADGLSPGAEIPVLRSAIDLHHRPGLRGLALFELVTQHPDVRLTEPGDVVVSVSVTTGPRAVVDHHGGAVVAYPARTLRCRQPSRAPTFVAEAVAADINALPRDAQNLRSWPLTVVLVDQVAALDLVLADVVAHRAALTAALADLDQLSYRSSPTPWRRPPVACPHHPPKCPKGFPHDSRPRCRTHTARTTQEGRPDRSDDDEGAQGHVVEGGRQAAWLDGRVAVQGRHPRVEALIQETSTLAELRDTLLPELMSGRLRVKDAVRQVEDAV